MRQGTRLSTVEPAEYLTDDWAYGENVEINKQRFAAGTEIHLRNCTRRFACAMIIEQQPDAGTPVRYDAGGVEEERAVRSSC